MKKRNVFILMISLSVLIVVGAILLAFKNHELKNNQIKIIDASYMCNQTTERFYEDDSYIYAFPCVKSNSVFVKFPNGNKMLVIKALEDEKITIAELIDAGLEVIKEKK